MYRSTAYKLSRVELAKNLEKAKQDLSESAKRLRSEADNWSVKVNKLANEAGQIYKEAERLDKDVTEVYSLAQQAVKTFRDLGIEEPRGLDQIDGVSLASWGNRVADIFQSLSDGANALGRFK